MLNTNFTDWPKYSLEEANLAKKILLSNKVNQWTGSYVKEFEKEFSKYHNVKYSIAVSNGSVALDLALKSLRLKKNSEIIVTSRSFVASATCILNNNLKPVFADVDFYTGNICVEDLKKKITKKTKAIIIVHLSGQACKMDEILKIKKKNKLFLIEDCSQSHGAKFNGKPTGSFGDIATWSFCQDKIMTTCGEGGMISTNIKKFYTFMNSYKDHGKNFSRMNKLSKKNSFKWLHDDIGTNFRLTEVQAAVGLYQLKRLDRFVKLRNYNANFLLKELKNFPEIYDITENDKRIYHSYYKLIVNLNKKNFKSNQKILDDYKKNGLPVFSGPCPEIYKEKVFKKFKFKTLRVAHLLSKNTLMFLVHSSLTKNDLNEMKKIIRKVSIKLLKELNV